MLKELLIALFNYREACEELSFFEKGKNDFAIWVKHKRVKEIEFEKAKNDFIVSGNMYANCNNIYQEFKKALAKVEGASLCLGLSVEEGRAYLESALKELKEEGITLQDDILSLISK